MKSAATDILRTPPLEDVPKHKDLIYDVGMHKGEDTEFYLRKGFRVVAFEADPDLAQLCRKRLKDHIDSGKLVVVEGAVLDEDAIATKKQFSFSRMRKILFGELFPQIGQNETKGLAARVIPSKSIP